MRFIIFFLLFFYSLIGFSQEKICDQFNNFDKFNSYYCDECPNLESVDLKDFSSINLGFELKVPIKFSVIEFYKDNKVFIFDSLARNNYKSFSVSLLDKHLRKTLDAFFLEYINTFFDNFVLDENQFFNYGNFYSPSFNGKYLYRSYNQGENKLFELSIFYYKNSSVYLLQFMGRQSNYYELLCDYLPIAYSFNIIN